MKNKAFVVYVLYLIAFILLLAMIGNILSKEKEELEIIYGKNKEPLADIVEENKIISTRKNISCSSSSTKTYMSYRAVTNKQSKQWDLIHNYMKVSDDGMLRSPEGHIGVALGSHFGELGSKFEIHLDTGIVFTAIKIDRKADNHTDPTNCFHTWDNSVIEFVIAPYKFKLAPNGYVWSGNFNNNPNYRGNIKYVYRLEE